MAASWELTRDLLAARHSLEEIALACAARSFEGRAAGILSGCEHTMNHYGTSSG